MSAFFVVSAIFFAFPLFAPAAGIVLYPFLFQGAAWAAVLRIPLSILPSLVLFGAATLLLVLVDPVGFLRIAGFLCGIIFLCQTVQNAVRLQFLLALAAMHAMIILAQLLLVMAGLPLDFSEILRSLYGSLLPPTGAHIDYNAFSQWDLYIPRVAGLNREPAFASLLFLGLLFIALRLREGKLALLFFAAVLCTMSKVVFPLIVAIALSLNVSRKRRTSQAARVLSNLTIFTGVHLLLIASVSLNLDLVEAAMSLDASFYHRFIGLHTLATQWDHIAWFGNSIDRVSSGAIFANYEFIDDRRAFLDGSVASKLAVDFGYIGLALYSIAAALVCRNALCAAGLALGGTFINLLSVSPATLLTFWLLTGMHAKLPSTAEYARQKLVRRARLRNRPPAALSPQTSP